MGWRDDYISMGAIGIVVGLIGIVSFGDVEKKCETQCDDEECCIEECKEHALGFFEEFKEDIDILEHSLKYTKELDK